MTKRFKIHWLEYMLLLEILLQIINFIFPEFKQLTYFYLSDWNPVSSEEEEGYVYLFLITYK